jgi:hypothetical protein
VEEVSGHPAATHPCHNRRLGLGSMPLPQS